MAALKALPRGERIEFVRLKALLNATEGNLGAHLGTLESAGYINIEKDFHANLPRTQASLTPAGIPALRRLRHPICARSWMERGPSHESRSPAARLGAFRPPAWVAIAAASASSLPRAKAPPPTKRFGAQLYVGQILVATGTALGATADDVFFLPALVRDRLAGDDR